MKMKTQNWLDIIDGPSLNELNIISDAQKRHEPSLLGPIFVIRDPDGATFKLTTDVDFIEPEDGSGLSFNLELKHVRVVADDNHSPWARRLGHKLEKVYYHAGRHEGTISL